MNTNPGDLEITDLRITREANGDLNLQQSVGCGEYHAVLVSPTHMRAILHHFGLVPITTDPTAARTIARLERRLRLVRDEVELLDSWLHAESSADRINLEEMVKCRGILVLLDEFIRDFEPETVSPATHTPDTPGKAAQASKKAAAEANPAQLPLE